MPLAGYFSYRGVVGGTNKMYIGGWRDARFHEVSVFLCPSSASQTCSFLGGCFPSCPTLFSWEQSPSQLRGDRTYLPCLALPSSRWDQPPPSQQVFGIGSRLTSLWLKTWPRTERETNAEDIFEEFQGIAESRPGVERRGGLGGALGLGTCMACGWMQLHLGPSYRQT